MERIHQKIGRIKEHLSVIRSIKGDCLTQFTTDPIYRGALLHYLYLLADSCIVLAELVIKYKNLRIPQSYSEAFDILGENKILEPSFAYILKPVWFLVFQKTKSWLQLYSGKIVFGFSPKTIL